MLAAVNVAVGAPGMTRFRVLGSVQALDGDQPVSLGGRKQLQLLAFLLLNANRAVSTDQLIDTLWGSSDPRAGHRLQVAVSRLRKTLEPLNQGSVPALRSVHGGYLFAVEDNELDAEVFEAAVEEGRRALAAGHPERAAELLRGALALWRGPPLAEVAFEDFAQPEIRRLEEARLLAVEARIDAELELGRHSALIGELEGLAAEHPTRERVAEQLMLALYRSGRQSDALSAYQRIRAHLAAELGLEPGPALKARQAQILGQADELELRPAPAPAPRKRPAPRRQGRPTGDRGAAQTRLPLPPKLSPTTQLRFVGRVAETELVRARWQDVRAGMRTGVLVAGEPGIGKTQFAAHAARELYASGAIVLYGHCPEELEAPYGPWIEALTPFVEHASDDILSDYVARHHGELSRIVPALVDRVPDAREPSRTDPESERYLLFAAVLGLLEQASTVGPTMLVLEDLHWADTTTLALLKHVLAEISRTRLLVLATYRDSELASEHSLTGLLADLRREERIDRVRLSGLSVKEIVTLMEHADARTAMAQAIASETDGNPFFVGEMLRHLSERAEMADSAPLAGRGPLELPPSVRDVIMRRVDRLGEDCRRVLCTASVIGYRFRFRLLAATVGGDEDVLLDLLDRAVQAHLVEERDSSFEFAHDLINKVLYATVGANRRSRMHRRVAEALEALSAGDPRAPVEDLARHWLAAVPHDAEKALVYVRQAGEQALEKLAPAEAVTWFGHALELLDNLMALDLSERCQVTIQLGEAQRQAGRPEFRTTLLTAAELAEQLDDSERMARAALANSRGFASVFGGVDRERIAVLERAADRDRSVNPARAAQLLSLQAMELQFDPDHRRRRELANEALALGRVGGDKRTLPYVLRNHFHAVWAADTLDIRRRTAAEMCDLATDTDDPLVRIWALDRSVHVAIESGELTDAAHELSTLRALTEQLGQPGLRWHSTYYAAGLAIVHGDMEEAERLADIAAQLGGSSAEPDTAFIYFGQVAAVRVEQGRAAEVVDVLEQAAAANPTVPSLEAAHAAVLCELGRGVEAAPTLERNAERNFAHLPLNQAYSSALALWSVVAAEVGSPRAAAVLYDLIEPWGDQFIWNGATGYGSAASCLGMLAARLGSHERAAEHFGVASEVHRREGVKMWEARTLCYWARSELDAGSPHAASATAGRALGIAQENHFEPSTRQAETLLRLAAAHEEVKR
jgi:DNA-binding SARP family transcriptional activator